MKKCILRCLFSLAVVCAALPIEACKETPPEPSKQPTLSLKAEDASCAEAWLKVSCTELPATIRLQILTPTTQAKQTIRLTTTDTLLIDEGLLPNRAYTYQLQRLNADSTVIETSASVQVTTMDTTSHNFTWSIDTLGVTSSVLYDVAIINDTLAYAVGEIFLNDSSGQLDPVFYNVAKWNGRTWKIMRLLSDCRLYWPNCGPVYFTASPGKAVFAFAPNDVWIVAGGVHHFDGIQWSEKRALVEIGGTNKMWGCNSANMWFVGNSGVILHYDGSTWQRVESGTTLPIMDVYGSRQAGSGSYEILAVAEAYGTPGASKIYSVENNTAREITTMGLDSWGVEGIWFSPYRQYIVVGQGVWRAYAPNGTWRIDENLPRIASTSISGNAPNDIVVGGAFWLLAHWNGANWETYFPRTNGSFVSVAVKGNMILAVGGIYNRAVAVIGRR